MDEYKDQVKEEQTLKPKLFNYPEWDSPVAVFDFEELENEDALLVLCVKKEQGNEARADHIAYVWTGPTFAAEEHDTDLSVHEFV